MQYVVRMLWRLVQLFPDWIRSPLRRSILLSSWYTALLCKVGMHPSVNLRLAEDRQTTTSDQPLDKDYAQNLVYQQQVIDKCLSQHSIVAPINTVLLTIDDWDRDACALSLHSINQQTVLPEVVIIFCKAKQQKLIKTYVSTSDWLLFDVEVVSELSLTNTSIHTQSGFVLYQGDSLHPDCLAYLASREVLDDFVYVDTDTIDLKQRFAPKFFPDWNPDLQLSTGYVNTGVYFSRLIDLANLSTSRDSLANFFKRSYIANVGYKIGHVPLVLLHQLEAQQDTINVEDTSLLFPIQAEPMVSMIVPTYNGKDLVEACLSSILEKTKYKNFEILLIDNNSDDEEALAYFESVNQHPSVRVLKYPFPFNYSAINNFAVEHAEGEVIALINNDIEVIHGDWLEKMLAHVLRPDIGCVGAKLLFANGLVQHAGVVMGYGGGAGHAHKYFKGDDKGYLNRAVATQNFSAVTAACLLVEKSDYLQIGGLNEHDLTVAFNDVDFCLRIDQLGKRNLLCAEAVLFHHESITRGHDDTYEKKKRFFSEVEYLQSTWKDYIAHDPAYNPNLTLKYENFTINTELSL